MEDKVDVVSDNLPVAEDITVTGYSTDSVDQPSPISHPHSEASAVISTSENEDEVGRFLAFFEFSNLLN